MRDKRPIPLKELFVLADLGSRKVYNKSIRELVQSREPVIDKSLFAFLLVIGILEKRKAEQKSAGDKDRFPSTLFL